MPPVRVQAYLLSLLARQYLALGATFTGRYPNAWLVWEPGEWAVPGMGVDTNIAETRAPSSKPLERPVAGDALCFALKPSTEGLTIGRAVENQIVINDMTVSRVHARLTTGENRWVLEAISAGKVTLLRRTPMPKGSTAALASGDALTLGGITMTFYDQAGFVDRLKLVAGGNLTPVPR